MRLLKQRLFHIALIQALTGLLGSLYFSEVMKLPPCNLCWYQRVLLYSLIPIIGWGIIRRDRNLPLYVLPFSITGLAVAGYHNLLQNGFITKSLARCTLDVPCDVKQIEWFGFVTIPFLSFGTFLVITICMLVAGKGATTND